MIDLVFRCFSRARWVTVASSRGICDAQGLNLPGFDIDEIGAPELVAAIRDGLGNIITPAVLDTWFWVNLRISGASETADVTTLYPGESEDGYRFTKSRLAKFVRDLATPVNLVYKGQIVRTYEFGMLTNRIQLVDPRDYAAIRCREWLGGMSF